tara:strand:- start:12344 stop:12556 length:213 start_codon:yes stop_codon:yes gene_type:complete
MNWSRKEKAKKWVKQHKDDAAQIWVKGSNVFLSIGDWAERDLVDELEDIVGRNVEWDYEVGHPGCGWENL